jgi:hypothetical protein
MKLNFFLEIERTLTQFSNEHILSILENQYLTMRLLDNLKLCLCWDVKCEVDKIMYIDNVILLKFKNLAFTKIGDTKTLRVKGIVRVKQMHKKLLP